MRRQRSHNNRANNNRFTVKASKFCVVHLQNVLRSVASRPFEQGGQHESFEQEQKTNRHRLNKVHCLMEQDHGSLFSSCVELVSIHGRLEWENLEVHRLTH